MTKETITLYFRQGSSDKFYTASINEAGNGKFVVPFTYGRRGTTGQSGMKTTSPVDWDQAKKVYDKLIKSKMVKGYQPGPGGQAHAGIPQSGATKAQTGYLPQLLNFIDEAAAKTMCLKDGWCAQEKKDGKRMILKHDPNKTIAINKKGQECGFPAEFEIDCGKIASMIAPPTTFTIDGEAVGETFYAFDLIDLAGCDVRGKPYGERYNLLVDLIQAAGSLDWIKVVPTAVTPEEKTAMIEALEQSGKEGIVFKRLDSSYKAGRPNSGGDQLKYKFYATATCRVAKVNTKRSIALELMDDSGGGKNKVWVGVGNCTIPANKDIPQAGAIVEIRYLYAYKGGSLYQPTYLGERDDQDEFDCLMSQLKYKSEEE